MDSGIAVVVAALIASTIGVLGYVIKGYMDRKARDRREREKRYIQMLKTLKGFYVGSQNSQLVQEFVDVLNESYLYASDDVIKAVNDFLFAVKVGVPSSDADREKAFQRLILTIRRDLRCPKLFCCLRRNTILVEQDIQIWSPPR